MAVAIAVATYLGINPPGFAAQTVALAFGLAAATIFPALMMGIFSTRINDKGAVWGMIVGLVFTVVYIFLHKGWFFIPGTNQFEDTIAGSLFGIQSTAIGSVGAVLNFAVAYLISSRTADTPAEIKALVESVRVPAARARPRRPTDGGGGARPRPSRAQAPRGDARGLRRSGDPMHAAPESPAPEFPTAEFLAAVPPWDGLPSEAVERDAAHLEERRFAPGERIYGPGQPLEGLYLIRRGRVRISDEAGAPLSTLGPRNAFGERGLMRDGIAPTEAVAEEETALLLLPAARFRALVEGDEAARRFFARARPRGADGSGVRPASLAETRVEALMSRAPATLPPETPIRDAARLMRERRISSVLVVGEGELRGILTIRDVSGRVVAGGLDPALPVSRAMTPEPLSLPPDAIGSDVLNLMMERGVGHVPILGPEGGVVGVVTQTDLTRFQAESAAALVGEVAEAPDADALAAATARIPRLLAQLVGTGHRHEVATRLVTDVADATTRRLLMMAEAELGPPPVPYLWLACGSQGRREQTGVSDQDNVLMLDDALLPSTTPTSRAWPGSSAAGSTGRATSCAPAR